MLAWATAVEAPPENGCSTGCYTTQLEAGGVFLGNAGDIALGAARERKNLLLLPTTTLSQTGKSERGSHQLHEATSGQWVLQLLLLLRVLAL
jgi:hypothetical protein